MMFSPVFLQTMNLLSGTELLPWVFFLDDGLLTAFFGGVVAGGSVKLAQLADTALPPGTQDQADHLEGVDHLALEGERDTR